LQGKPKPAARLVAKIIRIQTSNVAADPVYGLSMMGLSMMLRDADVEVTRLLIQDGTLQRPFRSIAFR
jgi:hypothetical protein